MLCYKISAYPVRVVAMLCCLFQVGKASDISEKRAEIASHTAEDHEKVLLLHSLAYEYLCEDEDSSSYLIDYAHQLADKLSYVQGIALSLQLKGILMNMQGKYYKAIRYYKQSIPYYRNLEDTALIASLYKNMGDSYRSLYYHDSAITCYYQSLKIRKLQEDKKKIAMLQNSIGILYKNMRDFDRALSHYRKSLAIYQQLEDSEKIGRVLYNMAVVKRENHQLDSALQDYQESLIYRQDSTSIMFSYNGLGLTYMLMGQYDKSLDYFDKNIAYYRRNSYDKLLAYTYNNVGDVYYRMGDYDNALKLRRQALQYSQSIIDLNLNKFIYIGMVDAFKGLRIFDSALYYTDRYNTIEANLYTIRRDSIVASLREAYQADILRERVAYLGEKDKRKQQWIWGISVISILSLILLSSWLINYRRKQRDQLQLLDQQKEIMAQRDEINKQVLIDMVKEQEIELQDGMRIAEQRTRNKIAYELHEGVQNIMAFSIISLEMIGNKLKNYLESQSLWEDYTTSIKMMRETKEDIRKISHNLRSEDIRAAGWLKVIRNFCDILNKSSDINIHFRTPNLEEVSLTPEKEIHITRILQELLHNIIKHSKADEVHLDISQKDEQIYIYLEDNGKGFDTKGTFEGVGIKHLRARAESMNSVFVIDSEEGHGTRVELIVPKDKPKILKM